MLNSAQPGLNFNSIDSLLSYIYYLTSTKNHNDRSVGYDTKELLEVHKGKSVLKIDKYIGCCVPSVDLEFVLESQGIQHYDTFIDPELNWKHSICNNEGVISEISSPDIHGDHFNPYIRFKSCISSSSRSCSMLMDLVGLETVNVSEVDPHDNVFLDIVCTFPGVVDRFLVNPVCRSRALHKVSKNGLSHKSELDIKPVNFIDRMNKCRKEFFHRLSEVFYCDNSNCFGMSSSLHVWSSEVPILPNCHVHNIIPGFTFIKDTLRDGLDIEDISLIHPEWFEEVFMEVPSGTKRVTTSKKFGTDPGSPKSTLISEVEVVHKYVVDRDKYKHLRSNVSNLLRDTLNFEPIVWSSHNSPVDIDKLKTLWSDIVYSEFNDIMDTWELLDIHVSWIPWYRKAKLRSALQYKVRPPVLDLDLFFKKCPGVVKGYDSLDLDKVLEFINYQLSISIKMSDLDKINRYESLLKKCEMISTDFSESDIYSWLQFLSTWVTDTRVYGFWKNLKHYLLDPEHKILVVEEVCPICNGFIADTSIKTKYCIVDHVLIQSQNKFMVYDLGDPGGK